MGTIQLSLSQKLVETNNICHAIALHIIASAHLSKGDIQNYIQSVSKAIPILENTIGENHSIYIDIMKELIHIHITTGNYIQAIPFIEKGIDEYYFPIWRKQFYNNKLAYRFSNMLQIRSRK